MSPTQGTSAPFGTPSPATMLNKPARKRKADNETLFDIPEDEMTNVYRINTAMTGAKMALTAAVAAAQKNFAIVAGQLDDEKVELINRVAAFYGKDTDVQMSLDVSNALLVYGDTPNTPTAAAFMEASTFAKPTMDELSQEMEGMSDDELATLLPSKNDVTAALSTEDKDTLLAEMKKSLEAAGFSAKVAAQPTNKEISAAVKNMSLDDVTRIALAAIKPHITQDTARHIVRYLVGADDVLHQDISSNTFLDGFTTSMGVVRIIATKIVPKDIAKGIFDDTDVTAADLSALFLPLLTPPANIIKDNGALKNIEAVKNVLKFLFELGYPD